jgi:two-component system response regulator AlgR
MRILIADDEPLARARLVQLLAQLGAPYRLSGEAADGQQALAACRGGEVDLVLLDIEMPGMRGIEATRQIAELSSRPAVILTTAHAEHALDAFAAGASGYLLKPVRLEALRAALERARQPTRAQQAEPVEAGFLRATLGGGIQRIPLAEVFYLKAEQKYVLARHAGGTALLDDSLSTLEERIGAGFSRVHRAALVARARVRGLERGGDRSGAGRCYLRFQGIEDRIEVSRRHLAEVRDWFDAL